MPTGVYERTDFHRKKISEGAKKGNSGKHMKGRKLPKEWRENIGNAQRGDKNYFWAGGKYISRGYVLIWQPHHPLANNKGYVYEHRLVMESKIGRFLKKEERVHHINEIKDDNRIENLTLFANEPEHQKHHWSIKNDKKTLHHRDKTRNH